jgi:hypothetical protein
MPSTTTVILPSPFVSGGKTFSRYVQTDADAPAITTAGPVSFASNTNPILILGTTFYAGTVSISGVLGNTAANGSWNVTGGGNVVSASGASPIVITTDAPHYLTTGYAVAIGGIGIAPWSTGSTAANGAWTITVLTPTSFSLNGSNGGGVAGVSVAGIAGSYSLGGMALIGSVGTVSGLYTGGGAVSRAGLLHISNAVMSPDGG